MCAKCINILTNFRKRLKFALKNFCKILHTPTYSPAMVITRPSEQKIFTGFNLEQELYTAGPLHIQLCGHKTQVTAYSSGNNKIVYDNLFSLVMCHGHKILVQKMAYVSWFCATTLNKRNINVIYTIQDSNLRVGERKLTHIWKCEIVLDRCPFAKHWKSS